MRSIARSDSFKKPLVGLSQRRFLPVIGRGGPSCLLFSFIKSEIVHAEISLTILGVCSIYTTESVRGGGSRVTLKLTGMFGPLHKANKNRVGNQQTATGQTEMVVPSFHQPFPNPIADLRIELGGGLPKTMGEGLNRNSLYHP